MNRGQIFNSIHTLTWSDFVKLSPGVVCLACAVGWQRYVAEPPDKQWAAVIYSKNTVWLSTFCTLIFSWMWQCLALSTDLVNSTALCPHRERLKGHQTSWCLHGGLTSDHGLHPLGAATEKHPHVSCIMQLLNLHIICNSGVLKYSIAHISSSSSSELWLAI